MKGAKAVGNVASGHPFGDAQQRFGNGPRRCRRADLILDNTQTVALAGKPQHRLDEIMAERAEHTRRCEE